MAIAVSRIEKDFFLKAFYDEQTPIVSLRNRNKYTLTLEYPVKGEMHLKSDRPIKGLWPRRKLYLTVLFKDTLLTFPVKIISVKDVHILTEEPKFIYKKLERNYSRIPGPPELQAYFTFQGDSYFLSYPHISQFEDISDAGDLINRVDIKNLDTLTSQIASWVKEITDGYQLVLFKDVKPATQDERLLAETGKILYLPSTLEPFPIGDPFPKKRLITADIFRHFLENHGVNPEDLDSAVDQYLIKKAHAHIYAEVCVPVLFEGYIVGYLRAWCGERDKRPFSYETLETFHYFASVLAFSLKENGFFESGRHKSSLFEGRIIDISAAGLLFACPLDSPAALLKEKNELSVVLKLQNRSINCNAKVTRLYRDNILIYSGCSLVDMSVEEIRVLFEFLYGRPFASSDTIFLADHV